MLVGGTLGYNWQRDSLLWGLEGDYSWSGVRGSTTCDEGSSCGTDMKSFGTLRGRVGIVADDMLVYFTGGWAVADVQAYDRFDPEEGAKVRWGWTVGGGLERKLQGPLSLKAEYLYADFGKADHFTNVGHTPEEISLQTHVFRLGLNFKLN